MSASAFCEGAGHRREIGASGNLEAACVYLSEPGAMRETSLDIHRCPGQSSYPGRRMGVQW